jgi:hypothetical protein
MVDARLHQPMSSPMMKRMLGLPLSCASALAPASANSEPITLARQKVEVPEIRCIVQPSPNGRE